MGDRAIANRVLQIRELEAEAKAAQAKADTLKAEIKKQMEANNTEEMQAGDFIVRWKKIISNRFNAKAFQSDHNDLYANYLQPQESRRLTIA